MRSPIVMLALIATAGCTSLACSTSVYRLDGDVRMPPGPATTTCEKQDWLVVAPTRAEVIPEDEKKSVPRDDGLGLYRVGSTSPESIPGLSDEAGRYAPDTFERHSEAVRAHDTKRIVAASMAGVGLTLLAVGSIVFVNSFDTVTTTGPGGAMENEQQIDQGQAVAGGLMMLGGLGIGIGGAAVNPSHSERTRADAARYVFLPPEDSEDEVLSIAERHNRAVRQRCSQSDR